MGCPTYDTINILSITGIQSPQFNSHFTIYPNPNKGQFTLEINSPRINQYNIRIFNSLGESVWSKNVKLQSNNKEKINLSALSKGVYIIYLQTSREVLTRKIIIH
jgi:hypothetical protein